MLGCQYFAEEFDPWIPLFRLLDLSDLTAKIPEVYGATIKAKQVATSII